MFGVWLGASPDEKQNSGIGVMGSGLSSGGGVLGLGTGGKGFGTLGI